MGDILLIGNGFDLAHNLPTSYNDFLFLMKNWGSFKAKYASRLRGDTINEDDSYYKYVINTENIDEHNIKELERIVKSNSWVNYYCNCEAEIDGWIDFEREIYPVIRVFEFIFDIEYSIRDIPNNEYEVRVSKDLLSNEIIRIADLWPKFFDGLYGNYFYIVSSYVSVQYGILKKRIIKELREDFDEFLRALEIYLLEFVHKRTDVEPLEQIKGLDIEHVISFNYTLTETLYDICEGSVHHIHGSIRTDQNAKNNMVVGINEQEYQNMDFIYFVKYFQRIQKNSGVAYKRFINEHVRKKLKYEENYKLYIYGHSLDETDEDILKYAIGNITQSGLLNLYPYQVIIFYYDEKDYEQKVINLIKLYGRVIVEKYMEDKSFEFIQIQG